MAQTEYVPNLRHPDPANIGATQWTSGVGAPSDANGNNGDGYINLSTGDIYIKTGDTWNLYATGGGGGGATLGVGSPVGVVTPTGEGEWYVDTSGPYTWISTGATAVDWQQTN